MDEYLPMFLAEGREHLQELNLAVVRIEEKPDDPETVDEIFRIAHSMKGMSATMGFAGMAALTHEMEDVFELLRQRSGGLERAAIDVLFDSLDALSAAVEAIDETGQEAIEPQALIERLQSLVRERTPMQEAQRAGAAPPPGQPRRAGRRPPRGPGHGDPQRGRLDAVRARLHGAGVDRRARRDARLPPVARTRSTPSTAARSTRGSSPSTPTPSWPTPPARVPEVADVIVFEAVSDAALDEGEPDELAVAAAPPPPDAGRRRARQRPPPRPPPPAAAAAAASPSAGRRQERTPRAAPRRSASTPSGSIS